MLFSLDGDHWWFPWQITSVGSSPSHEDRIHHAFGEAIAWSFGWQAARQPGLWAGQSVSNCGDFIEIPKGASGKLTVCYGRSLFSWVNQLYMCHVLSIFHSFVCVYQRVRCGKMRCKFLGVLKMIMWRTLKDIKRLLPSMYMYKYHVIMIWYPSSGSGLEIRRLSLSRMV